MAAVLGTVALTGMVGCGKGKTANLGAASISVGAAKLTLVDVKSVTVTISGGISTPLTVPLVGSGSQYSALVSDLPVGTNYTFTASAKNASSVEIYHGAATGVAIIKNQTAAVIIDMNQVAPVVSISNEAPVIDSLTASSLLVAQGDTVTIKASGHDPDPGQTALLTSSWATTCGTLSPQVDTTGNDTTDGTSTVTFTAPLADGPCTVNLTVTDPNGVLKNVASLTIQVGAAAAVGSAKMTANLDTYPVISGLNATPVPLVKGAASTLTVTASDSDGDALNYLWTVGPNANGSGTCTGSFGSNTQASTTFTLDNTSTMAECTFLVRVDDGNYPDGTAKGGVITNHLSLPVSGPVAQGGPVFGYDYQSQTTIKGGDVVGFALVANQGCAGANLNVTAVASDGTLIGASSPAALGLDPSVFTVAGTYTAPPNAENLPSVTITATGTCVATGLTATHVFTLVPLNSVCNGMADGTNCTATASAGNACVLSASCLAGVCHVDTSHTCPASGDPCNINTCIPATGSCTLVHDSVGQGIALTPPINTNNTGCNDNNLCTTGDLCTAGVCAGAAKDCSSAVPAGLAGACLVASCNTTNGNCGTANKPNGTSCDDGNGCTGTITTPWTSTANGVSADSCVSGSCVGQTAGFCPSGDVCTSVAGNDNQFTCPVKVCLGASAAVSFNPALNGMGVAADGTLWTTGSLVSLPSSPYNFGAGPVSSTGSQDVFLNKVSPTTLLATQSFTFGYVGGYDQTGNGVAVAHNSSTGANNIGVIGNYYTEVDFDPIRSGDTSYNGGNGPIDNLDFLSKSSNVAGAPTNFVLVADGASTMPEITPLKAHNIDVGTGAILAIASNPNQNLFAICGKSSRLVGAYTAAATNTGLLTAGWGGTGSGTPVTGAATAGGSMDIVVAVIDAGSTPANTGKVLWGRQFGGVGDQVCESLAMDNAGNVVMAGTYNGALSFGDPALFPALQLPTVGASGLSLMFVATLDTTGTVQKAASWGTTAVSDLNGVAVDSNSNIVIAGNIGASVNMGGSIGAVTYYGKNDGFVAKLNSNLVPQWAVSFGDADYNQTAKAVALTSSGDVLIGGAFDGVLNGLNGLTASGNTALDAFTAQLSGTNGSVLCAQAYGDANGTQQVFAVTVATAATGTLANSVTFGGSYSGGITFGAYPLNTGSPGTAYSFLARLVP
jgi:ribosomal protein S5